MRTVMRFTPLIFFLLLPSALGTSSTSTQETCYTKKGPVEEHSVPTTTHTSTYHHTATCKETITPSRTVTPCAKTVTCTQIVHTVKTITESRSTDTYRTTSTAYTTAISISTITSTSTSTTTTTTTESPTSTIPPSPGFTPISSELVQQGYTLNKKLRRNGRIERRQTTPSVPKASPIPSNAPKVLIKDGHPACEPPQYPESVSCSKCIDVYTTTTQIITASQTRTVSAKASTVTKTVTNTITSTCDVVPKDASTVLHFSTTSTIHSTTTITTISTSTSTATSTSILPTATHYAVCDPDNIVSRLNGYPIGVVIDTQAGGLIIANANTAYDCCVACINYPDCGGSAFSLTPNDPEKCYLASADGTCNPAEGSGGFETDNVPDTEFTDPGFDISNSNCGQWQYRGNLLAGT